MRLALTKHYSPLAGGKTGGFVACAFLLLVWLPLVLRHSAVYGVAPDLSFHGWSLATTWAGPLVGFVFGALALGVGVGQVCYSWIFNPYARHMAPWKAVYFWRSVVLAALGGYLVARGLPAASDVTLSAPKHVFGYTHLHGEAGVPFGQSSVTIGQHNYIVPLPKARAYGGECVSIIYGPNSMTAFSVVEPDLNAASPYCIMRGIGP